MICPHCHAVIDTKRKARKPAQTTTMGELSDAQLFKHYHDTAPLEDLRFWLRHGSIRPDLKAAFVALEIAATQTTVPRAEFYRQFRNLQDRWRRDTAWTESVTRNRRIVRKLQEANARTHRQTDRKECAA